ncbi:MAG: SDR family oxidoreductase [Acidimicrobiia bacterium]
MAVMIDYAGRVVLVTGGTKGVGRGIAGRFADAGASVAVCARSAVDDLPDGWVFVPADLRDGDLAFAAIDEVIDRCGRLDVLVNNAGGSPPVVTASASPRLTERIIALNLLSAIYCSQRANHHMQEQADGGAIVNIASVSGTRPSPLSAAYGAAKAGLVNYTKTAAHEWAPKVRANAVIAGLVRTEQSHLFYGDDAGIARVAATIPLGRLAEPTDVGDVCLFLGSSLAAYVTGAAVDMSGGGDRPAYLDAAG